MDILEKDPPEYVLGKKCGIEYIFPQVEEHEAEKPHEVYDEEVELIDHSGRFELYLPIVEKCQFVVTFYGSVAYIGYSFGVLEGRCVVKHFAIEVYFEDVAVEVEDEVGEVPQFTQELYLTGVGYKFVVYAVLLGHFMEYLPDEVLLKIDHTALGKFHRFVGYDQTGTVVVCNINAEYTSIFPDIHALHEVVIEKDDL